METFADIESKLKSEGFKVKHTRHDISVFESGSEYAYVYFLGPGKGFECTKYPRKDIPSVTDKELLEVIRGLLADILVRNVNAQDEGTLNILYPHRIKAIEIINKATVK